MSENDEITITLRISAWRIVTAHLELGAHREVAQILRSIYAQADPKIIAAMERDAEMRAQAATAAAIAPTPPESVSESEPAAQQKQVH